MSQPLSVYDAPRHYITCEVCARNTSAGLCSFSAHPFKSRYWLVRTSLLFFESVQASLTSCSRCVAARLFLRSFVSFTNKHTKFLYPLTTTLQCVILSPLLPPGWPSWQLALCPLCLRQCKSSIVSPTHCEAHKYSLYTPAPVRTPWRSA